MKKIVIAVIIWGTIAYAINMIFGMDTITFFTKVNVNNSYFIYKIDVWKYLENLKNSFNTISILSLNTPTGTWNQDIINNLSIMLNWTLFSFNVILYPFRVGGYVTLQIMAVLGIDTIHQNMAGGLNWLVIVSKFLRDLQIPFI